jgi:adenylate cyclase
VDTTTGRQVWARAFKHSLAAADLIETQEEIAANVVAAIASDYGIIARRLAAESRKKRPAELSTYEAMLRYYSYQIAPSPAASAPCFEALSAAVEREPDYGPAWSALATLHCQMYVFDQPGFDDPLATGLSYAQRGVFLEPGRQLSRLILAYASLLDDDLGTYRTEAETALSLNPNNPYAIGATGYMNVLVGNLEEGCRLIDRAKAISPVRPQWFRHGYYLAHYGEGDYQGALNALTPVEDPDPWEPALVSAALGKLGRSDEAVATNALLKAWKPDLGLRIRELLQRPVKSPELVEELIDGLRKAGAFHDDDGASAAGPGARGR